jgi:hypothetical protein
MWEAQERFTNADTFYKPLFAHLVSTMRNFSNQTISNLLRSIGTLCYRDPSVDLVIGEAERRAVLSKDMQMIQTLVATAVNLGSKTFKDEASMMMFEVFSQEYQERQEKAQKAKHAEHEKGQRYLQLLSLSRTLAKVENYENPIFPLLFKELKHIIVFNQLNPRR